MYLQFYLGKLFCHFHCTSSLPEHLDFLHFHQLPMCLFQESLKTAEFDDFLMLVTSKLKEVYPTVFKTTYQHATKVAIWLQKQKGDNLGLQCASVWLTYCFSPLSNINWRGCELWRGAPNSVGVYPSETVLPGRRLCSKVAWPHLYRQDTYHWLCQLGKLHLEDTCF